MRGTRPQIHKGQTCHDGAQGKTETMNLRIGCPDTSYRPWLLCAAPAAGLRKETADVIVRLLSIVFLPPRHFGPALTGARVWAIRLTRAGILRHRRRGTILRTLRVLRPVVVRNTPGCWRGTPGKANVSLPFAVVVFVCHLYRLVSCITRPSYKKDVQQMRTYAKTSVSGMDGSEPGVIKRRPPRAIDSRHQNGRLHRVAPFAVRPKNGAARFAVLPSVELRAALLRQGRILKPWNKSARQNGPRKG